MKLMISQEHLTPQLRQEQREFPRCSDPWKDAKGATFQHLCEEMGLAVREAMASVGKGPGPVLRVTNREDSGGDQAW